MLADKSLLKYISAPDLQKSLSSRELVVIDIRSPEAFEELHIPQTINICVYETVFTEKVGEVFPDKSTRIILVGQGGGFHADEAAAARLFDAGYASLELLEGGLDLWVSTGYEVRESPSSAEAMKGDYSLDPESSRVYWTGRNLLNQHMGQIAAKEGTLKLDESGLPVKGRFVVDMMQMVSEDIEDPGMAEMLIGHLSSIDFFDVEKYPTSSFTFEKASSIADATPGSPNYNVYGTLEARGRKMPLEVDALVAQTEKGITFKSVFEFDRTHVGALYGSGRIFERLGMHLVQDLVTMDIRLVFKK